MNTNIPEPAPLTIEQRHGRRVFESTMRSVEALVARGVPPGAVVLGLLAVITVIGNEAIGPRAMRRLLMNAADANADIDG